MNCRFISFILLIFAVTSCRIGKNQLSGSYGDSNTRPVISFTVNSAASSVDAVPGDLECDDGAGNCTIQAAVDEANTNSANYTFVINVPAGTYNMPTNYYTVNADVRFLAFGGAVTLDANPDASPLERVMQIGTSGGPYAVEIDGFVLRNANNTSSAPGGAGIYANNMSTLTIKNSEIRNNTVAGNNGAGINMDTGNLIIENTLIQSNTGAGVGQLGGGVAFTGSSMTIRDSRFLSNAHEQGGGIYFFGTGELLIEDTVFDSNVANFNPAVSGSAILRSKGSGMTIRRSYFTNNEAAIAEWGVAPFGSALIEDTTFSNNNDSSVVYFGTPGANQNRTFRNVIFYHSTPSAYHTAVDMVFADSLNIIFENTVLQSGLYDNGASTNINISFKQSLLTQAAGSNCSLGAGVTVSSTGYNVTGDNTGDDCNLTGTGDINNTNALLVAGAPAANGGPLIGNSTVTLPSILLQPGSPARNITPTAQCELSEDIRNLPRPGTGSGGPNCDAGATEMQNGE